MTKDMALDDSTECELYGQETHRSDWAGADGHCPE